MTNLMSRMKSSLRRVGDWITGHDVDVAAGPLSSGAARQAVPPRRPRIDVLESEHELMLVADVPGAHPDATRVHVDGGRLTILARVPNVANAHVLSSSASDADWYVDFALPNVVDADSVHAVLRDGVLTVRLPNVVDADSVHAVLRDGVLTVRLPKRERPCAAPHPRQHLTARADVLIAIS